MADATEHKPPAVDLCGTPVPSSDIAPAGKLSFEQIVRDHLDEITRLAYRLLGWQSDVEDIIQDVFLTAAQKLNTLRDKASVRAWLYQITINKCRTWRYRQKLRLRFWTNHRWEREHEISSSDKSEIYEREAGVRSAVRALPTKYREAVVLKYLEQLPADEIARILKINENTLNVRLLRARAMLREILENEK